MSLEAMQFALKQNNKSNSLSIADRSAITWRYHVVSVLLFIIKIQYKLLLLIPLVGVACLYFPLWALQHLRNGLQRDRSQPKN